MKQYPHNIKKVYGPYTRQDGREVVVIHLEDGKTKTKSLARYQKEIELGRELDPHTETVDHKNRVHTDNTNDNLQLLSRSDNAKKSALRLTEVKMDCVWCGVNFTLSNHQIKNQRTAGPFCSKSCSGKYGASLQNGVCDKKDIPNIERKYYRNDD